MAFNDPFVRGENAVLTFYQQSGAALKKVNIACKNWKVSENATEIAEGVNGENRDRLDKVINYYECTFDIYQPDVEFMTAYIAAQDNDDANGFPLKQTFAVMLKTPRGNYAYSCQEGKVGPCDTNLSSRSDAVMVSVKARFRYYKQIPAV